MKNMAMTQNFVRVATDEKDDKKYLRYKQMDDNIKTTVFNITLFNGYHGKTLACRTNGIYDLYRVFDKDGNLICESEDEVIELPEFDTEGMKVYAYKDNYLNIGVGKIIDTIPPREHSRYYNLSVVIPLYNSELFMCRTIDSILSSSLEDIELILIDDGSSDKSYEIAKWYQKEYGCVRAFHWDNHGVSFTRNHGMDLASGEYLAFCDNDDIVHPYMYEKLFLTCKTVGTDIAICPALIRKDINDKEFYLTCEAKPENIVVYDFDEMVDNRGTKGNMFRVAVWNKIVNTEVARKAQFPTGYTGPGILYEDVAYTSSLYSYIDKFALCKDAFYTWDKRKQKTVGTASTWHSKYDNEYVWKMFIYGFSYALYHKSDKHTEAHDYTHFKRLIESYDKFDRPSPLRSYWDLKLREIITDQKLNQNKRIMADEHLNKVIRNLGL